MDSAAITPPHVGIFDSGIGGFSVLRKLRQTLPGCSFTYLADNRHLPYGDKSPEWLAARATSLTAHLLAQEARLILVACNTATTHAIAALRARWPDVPFVGVEPGIKPAAQRSQARRIAVMATPATLRSARLQQLAVQHAADCSVHLLACADLAAAIEQAEPEPLERSIAQACDELRRLEVDTVVLGCTHYPLVADQLAARLGPEVQWIDTADAVSRRVAALLGDAPDGTSQAALTLVATGDPHSIERAAQRWIGSECRVSHCPL